MRTVASPRRLLASDFGIGQLFAVVGDAVIVGDVESGRIALWNPAAETMFGYSADEAVGQPLEMLIPEELKEGHRAGMARFAGGGASHLVGTGKPAELPAVRKDGSELWIQLTLSPVATVLVEGRFVLALIRDVTDRRDAETQLAAANESLRDFMRMAAHDLRNPLTVVQLSADLLTSHSTSPDDARLIASIGRQTRHLFGLIDDLAALSELASGQTQPNPDRCVLVDVAIDAQESAGLASSRIALDVPIDLTLWVDRGHLVRILANYLVNAERYGGGAVRIRGRALAGRVEIRVEDHGAGVAASFVPRLFDKFARGDGVGDQTGSGLGLAIVAGLAALNAGDAWYEPNTPRGSRFCISLPASCRG